MNKQAVIIIDSSGLSKVIIDIFEKEGKYQILGFYLTNIELNGTSIR